MRLIARDDTFLTAALIASTVIAFRQPLHDVLGSIQDIEGRLHLDLVPALLLLVMAISLHGYGKRREAKAEARAAAADAAQARAQAKVLQQLMVFSHALASALDRPTLQQVLATHLPPLAPDGGVWVLMRTVDRWDPILIADAKGIVVGELVTAADRAVAPGAGPDPVCVPLGAGSAIVGVLGVSHPVTGGDRRVLEAAAAVLAIAIRNMQLFKETHELSLRDSLTGCFNRHHALQTLESELRRVRRTNGALSIVMFDIDHFKTVNDQLGHLRGDELLAMVGGCLAQTVRTSDVRCRYGGDEFLVILPDTGARGAAQVAETIRRQMAGLQIAGPGGKPMTISVGVASVAAGETDPTAIIDRADAALYRAKERGRNRVCVAEAPDAITAPSSAARAHAPSSPSAAGPVAPGSVV